jgi:glycosyltransferase involved in cell wall biosynthesis
MKLCLVTDAWEPQINGVVTTLTNLVHQASQDGWEVMVLHPGMFPNTRAPGYPSVSLSLPYGLREKIEEFAPDHLHIATEGPLGIAARYSFRRETYTTAYHTQWADFLWKMLKIPRALTWKAICWFHQHGKVMVPTASIAKELVSQGVKSDVVLFGRGVDLSKLMPCVVHAKNAKPRLLSVGRVSREKNLEAFCELDPEKYDLVMVGDGPLLPELRAKYPHVTYTGMLRGSDLADQYVMADCMLFTSRHDTFGLVIIESQVLGTPVAAYPVPGPIDVMLPETGAMDEDLEKAVERALLLDRDQCARTAKESYSWQRAWEQFRDNLVNHQEKNG